MSCAKRRRPITSNAPYLQRTEWNVRDSDATADSAATSHNPDGTLRPDYPQALQPRDRSGAEYLAQQRRIAGNPNLAEDALSGTTDRGTPIMAVVDGNPVTVMGNGRANAKALMFASPDFAEARDHYRRGLPDVAATKGIQTSVAQQAPGTVLTRLLLTPLSTADLRTLSQESNEFAGQQTNATEQAKIDAGRLTPAILARINPEFDLAASANAAFRAEATEALAGRGANLTESEILRRVRNALFAKAYADTDAGMAAFARLATEQEDGVRSLVAGLMDAAPAVASLRQSIADGSLHPVDPAPEIARAVQDITTTLRDRPAKQSATAALDALLAQGELGGISERDPAADAILRALLARRRNAPQVSSYIDAYINATYAAGDPRVEDMFGASTPTKADLFAQADRASQSPLLSRPINPVIHLQSDPRLMEAMGKAKANGTYLPPIDPSWGIPYIGNTENDASKATATKGPDGQLILKSDKITLPETYLDDNGNVDFHPLSEILPTGRPIHRPTVHAAIVHHLYLKKAVPTASPTVVFLGGGTAAGKSTLKTILEDNGSLSREAVTLNTDEIRGLLPEYQSLLGKPEGIHAAANVHAEASALHDRILEEWFKREIKSDIVIDAILGNPKKTIALMNRFREAGYKIVLRGVTTDPAESLLRATTRALKTGRYAPTPVILEGHKAFNTHAQ